MRFLQVTTIIVLLAMAFAGCTKKQEDPRIGQLQSEVAKLKDENQNLQQEIADLRSEVQTMRSTPATSVQPSEAQPTKSSMTVSRMKSEIAPLLNQAIERTKASSSTEPQGSEFGMQVEYDLKSAVYGLIRSDDEASPYKAKVLVPFERFLVKGKVRRSYGKETAQFLFQYRNGKWTMIKNSEK